MPNLLLYLFFLLRGGWLVGLLRLVNQVAVAIAEAVLGAEMEQWIVYFVFAVEPGLSDWLQLFVIGPFAVFSELLSQ